MGAPTVQSTDQGPDVPSRLHAFSGPIAGQPGPKDPGEGAPVDIEKAQAIYRRVMDRSRPGRGAGQPGDPEDLEGALAADPDNPELLDKLAEAHTQGGNPARAAELLKKLVGVSPGREAYHHRLGTSLMAAQRPTEAIRAFERLIEQFPAGPYALEALSHLLRLRTAGRTAAPPVKFSKRGPGRGEGP